MDYSRLILIALALSMDAAGVSLSLGIGGNLKRKSKALFGLSFGFFQFLCTFIGAYLGVLFSEHFVAIPCIIGGMIISTVGVFMIKDGMQEKEQPLVDKPQMYFILGISVSVDALVVGFTIFQNLRQIKLLLWNTGVIGVITLVISILAFILAEKIKSISFIAKYADYIGGIILFLFGMKMIFS